MRTTLLENCPRLLMLAICPGLNVWSQTHLEERPAAQVQPRSACGMLKNPECVPGGNSCLQDLAPSRQGSVSCMCQAVCLGGIRGLPIKASRTSIWGMVNGQCSVDIKATAKGGINAASVWATNIIKYTLITYFYESSDSYMDCEGHESNDPYIRLPC